MVRRTSKSVDFPIDGLGSPSHRHYAITTSLKQQAATRRVVGLRPKSVPSKNSEPRCKNRLLLRDSQLEKFDSFFGRSFAAADERERRLFNFRGLANMDKMVSLRTLYP